LLAGRCGISRLPAVADDSPLPVKIAGCIPDAELAAALARLKIDDEPDRSSQLGLYVAGRALQDAGLSGPREMDVILGTGHGNVAVSNEQMRVFTTDGYRKIRPTTVLRVMFNRTANVISIRHGLTGTSHVVSCACATGSIAFGEAFHRLRFDVSDAALAACCDTGLDLPTFAAWNRLGVLSKIPEPERASRPFDQGRQGLVMGEGGAAFVLETFEAAKARGARILAEVMAYGTTSDAKHLVHPDSAQQVRAVRKALDGAGVRPDQVGYVNAHGTATEVADLVEAQTIREVFGGAADRIPV